MTTKCAKYTDRHSHSPDDDIVWVDTVGWDDADLRDDSTFKDILRFIGKGKAELSLETQWLHSSSKRYQLVAKSESHLVEHTSKREEGCHLIQPSQNDQHV